MNEEKVNQVNDKKSINGWVILLLCLLFAVIFGVGGWFLGTKYYESENKENEKETEVVESDQKEEDTEKEVKPDKNSKYTFLKEESKTLKFGESSVELYSYYYLDKESVLDSTMDNANSVETYVLRREVYLDNVLIGGTHLLGNYDNNQAAILAILNYPIKDYVSLKDTKNGEYYNIIDIDKVNSIVDGAIFSYDSHSRIAYLVDKDGMILKEISTKFAGSGIVGLFADDTMITGKYYELIPENADSYKPEGKKYYLYPKDRLIDAYDSYLYYFGYADNVCSFNEKKLVIENGKVVETLLNTYTQDMVSVAGQSC